MLAIAASPRYNLSDTNREETTMKLGLINSAWVQANQPTVYGLRKTKELGFDTVDIFVDPLDIDIRERRLIKDE